MQASPDTDSMESSPKRRECSYRWLRSRRELNRLAHAYNGNIKCHKCGKKGHLKRDCPASQAKNAIGEAVEINMAKLMADNDVLKEQIAELEAKPEKREIGYLDIKLKSFTILEQDMDDFRLRRSDKAQILRRTWWKFILSMLIILLCSGVSCALEQYFSMVSLFVVSLPVVYFLYPSTVKNVQYTKTYNWERQYEAFNGNDVRTDRAMAIEKMIKHENPEYAEYSITDNITYTLSNWLGESRKVKQIRRKRKLNVSMEIFTQFATFSMLSEDPKHTHLGVQRNIVRYAAANVDRGFASSHYVYNDTAVLITAYKLAGQYERDEGDTPGN